MSAEKQLIPAVTDVPVCQHHIRKGFAAAHITGKNKTDNAISGNDDLAVDATLRNMHCEALIVLFGVQASGIMNGEFIDRNPVWQIWFAKPEFPQ